MNSINTRRGPGAIACLEILRRTLLRRRRVRQAAVGGRGAGALEAGLGLDAHATVNLGHLGHLGELRGLRLAGGVLHVLLLLVNLMSVHRLLHWRGVSLLWVVHALLHRRDAGQSARGGSGLGLRIPWERGHVELG